MIENRCNCDVTSYLIIKNQSLGAKPKLLVSVLILKVRLMYSRMIRVDEKGNYLW